MWAGKRNGACFPSICKVLLLNYNITVHWRQTSALTSIHNGHVQVCMAHETRQALGYRLNWKGDQAPRPEAWRRARVGLSKDDFYNFQLCSIHYAYRVHIAVLHVHSSYDTSPNIIRNDYQCS